MKRGTGKKIILLAVLLAIVGGIVYTVLTWPIYPQPQKSVDSYAQLRQDMEKTGVLVPPENVLPWVETFYSQELDGRDRLSKPRAFLMSGTVEYGGASYRAEIFESQKWTFEWRAEISLRENYRMTPIYRDASDNSMLYFLCIDGHIYTVQVYAGGDDPPGCRGLLRRSPAGGVSHGGGSVSVTANKRKCAPAGAHFFASVAYSTDFLP